MKLLFPLIRIICYTLCRVYFRIEFRGVEHIPSQGPLILAPNHTSYLDPLWVSLPFRYPLRYMTWERVFSVPLLGCLIRLLGAFPVKLDSGDRAALRQALIYLRNRETLMIFPEGGRTRNGEPGPFKPGVVRLALDAQAPILPVTIVGGYKAFSPLHRFPRPRKIIVIYHQPVYLTPPPDEAAVRTYLFEQSSRLQQIVASGLSVAALASQTRG
jgi:1-acyl-sn-glycerol-3-phosphate acyltransferase